jgi:RNA polymerase sigma factor (sigma-70 family)
MSSLLQHLPSDEQLTTAVAAGDHAAFEELYRRYARPLAAYGGRVLRDRSRGEDVAQTSLMRAYDALQRGTEPLRVKPWLYKIALNTALELKAKNGEVSDGESEEPADTSSDFRAARADIVAGVQDLPERQRHVFVLREIKGLPVGEVARRLELTNQQVEQALFAARNRLAEVLVFGERVSCETVRGLDRSQLTHYERRALKSHLRACPSCRRKGGFGLSALGFWLRDAWAWLVGGGASAAKLGAVAVTATVVGAAPVVAPAVVHKISHQDGEPVQAAATVAPQSLERIDRLGGVFGRSLPRPEIVSTAVTKPPAHDPFADLPIVNEELAAPEAAPEAAAPEPAPPATVESPPAPSPEPAPRDEVVVEREPIVESDAESSEAPLSAEGITDESLVERPTEEPSPTEEAPPAEEPVADPAADTTTETRDDPPPEDPPADNSSATP